MFSGLSTVFTSHFPSEGIKCSFQCRKKAFKLIKLATLLDVLLNNLDIILPILHLLHLMPVLLASVYEMRSSFVWGLSLEKYQRNRLGTTFHSYYETKMIDFQFFEHRKYVFVYVPCWCSQFEKFLFIYLYI